MKSIKRWTVVFKALSNLNRLKILELLSSERRLSVGEIAAILKISFTATSNNLVLLEKLDILESEGTAGHVYYSFNKNMPKDFQKIISFFTS